MADEVVETPFGKFLINTEDLIGSTLKAGTVWDGSGFLQLIAREAMSFDHDQWILDVGANQGAFTIWCADQGWKVVAVEPVPQVVQRLKANLDLNKDRCAEKVVVVPFAAYNLSTRLRIGPVDEGNLGGTTLLVDRPVGQCAGGAWVKAIPLDSLQPIWNRIGVGLIVIDTQGSDGAALFGLVETIRRWHPIVVFEWEQDLAQPHGYTFEEVRGWLEINGYQVIEWPSHPGNWVGYWQEGTERG